MAVDDLAVEMPGGTTDTLHRAVDGVAGAVVETVAPADGFHDPMAALSLAATLAAHRGRDHVTELVRALPEALWASWSCGLKVEDGSIEILSTSVGAPPSIHLIELPWMPLGGPRRLPTAMWMPPAWQMRRYELSHKASHGRAALEELFCSLDTALSGVAYGRFYARTEFSTQKALLIRRHHLAKPPARLL